MPSLVHLPSDCLYGISSFLGLGSVRSLLLTCSSLHAQLTPLNDSKPIWRTQLNHLLVAEIELLEMTDKSKKSKKFKDSLCKEIGRLNSQLKDQEKLLRRYGQKQQNKERYFGNENQGEIKGEANEAPYTAFAVYSCLRQSYFSRVVRRMKFQMKAIIERMKVAPSIKASIELFEEAVMNNDLSVFKSGVVLNKEEWRRIEHQEHVLWSIKSNGNSFLVHFLNSIVEQRGDLRRDTLADSCSRANFIELPQQ